MRFITAKRDEGKKMFKQWTFYGDIRISIDRKTKQKKKEKKSHTNINVSRYVSRYICITVDTAGKGEVKQWRIGLNK